LKFIIVGSSLLISASIMFSALFITGAIIGNLLGYGDNLFSSLTMPLSILSFISFLSGITLIILGFKNNKLKN
jgi:hypothetical protein